MVGVGRGLLLAVLMLVVTILRRIISRGSATLRVGGIEVVRLLLHRHKHRLSVIPRILVDLPKVLVVLAKRLHTTINGEKNTML